MSGRKNKIPEGVRERRYRLISPPSAKWSKKARRKGNDNVDIDFCDRCQQPLAASCVNCNRRAQEVHDDEEKEKKREEETAGRRGELERSEFIRVYDGTVLLA